MREPTPAPVAGLGRIGILRPLRIRDFALLWAGLTISLIGDGIYLVAIAWQVYDISNTPTALAMVGLAWTAPMVVLLLFAGVLSDRVQRRRLMLAADVIRGVAIGAIGALTLTGAVELWHLIALVAVYGSGEALFGPAFTSITPDLVPPDQLVQANSLGQFVRPFAQVLVGPAIGGVLVGTIGAGWAFVADAGTFAFSGLMILLMRPGVRARAADATDSVGRDLAEGIRFVRSHAWLWIAMVAATVSLLCFWGPFEVLVPFVVRNSLGGSATDLGLVFAAGGAGAVVAAVVMGQRGLPRKPITLLYFSWALGTFMLAGFGVATSLWPMFLVSAVSQASFTVLMIIWYTLIHRLVPSNFLGRVSSLDWLVSTAGVPVSFALTGPAAAAFGEEATLIAAGLLGSIVILLFMLIPGARGPERDGSLRPPMAIVPPTLADASPPRT